MECSGLPIRPRPLRGRGRLPHKWGRIPTSREARQAVGRAVSGAWGATFGRVAACLLLGLGLNRERRGLRHVVSRAHLYRSIWGLSSLYKQFGNSDLGGQLRVFLFVDQVVQFPWIFHVDAQQPPGAIWLRVDDVRVFKRFGIDLDDLAADRSLDR